MHRAQVVSLALLAAVAAGHAAEKPKHIKPKDVLSIAFEIVNPESDGTLVPGATYKWDLKVTDKKNKVWSLQAGTLISRDLSVQMTGASSGSTPLVLQTSSVPADAANHRYTFAVTYGIDPKHMKKAERAYPLDMAYVNGPQPADVVSFEGAVIADAPGGLLRPGSSVRIKATATDKRGRKFTTDGSSLKLPVDRLHVAAEHFGGQGLSLTASEDFTKLATAKYKLSINYIGRSDLVTAHEWTPDLAAVFGPEPEKVTSMTVTLGGGTPKLVPGASVPVLVTVTDDAGRTYSTAADSKLRLPRTRLKLSGENLELNDEAAVAVLHPDSAKMVGKKFQVATTYVGRNDVAASAEYDPDFLTPLLGYMLTDKEWVENGPVGEAGESSGSGAEGRYGASSSKEERPGGDGGPGGRGGNGRAGGRGGRGPNFRIAAVEAWSIDRSDRLVALEVKVGNTEPRYFLRRYDDPALRVVSAGGRGGRGGAGGAGGRGGKGGSGYSSGNGGNGGDGGNGGRGGNGGDGGDIVLMTADETLASLFQLESVGGAAGQGGAEGAAGSGGSAGSSTAAMVGRTIGALAGILASNGTAAAPPPPPRIESGPGESGQAGNAGDPGQDGRAARVVVEKIDAAALIGRLPQALRNSLLFPETSAPAVASR